MADDAERHGEGEPHRHGEERTGNYACAVTRHGFQTGLDGFGCRHDKRGEGFEMVGPIAVTGACGGFEEFGGDGTGTERGDGDALRAEFDGERFREAGHIGFRGGIDA